MAITPTPRLGLPHWGAGSDSPSRDTFNGAFDAIDDKAAYDDGAAGGSALPTSDVVNGRYAATVNGSYRKLYRRAGGAWTQVGGNTWEETTYARADTGLPTSGAARIVSHPNLANPTATEYWDGSSSRGGLQAISDLNSGQPGALHVGSTDPVSLATRGRVYARTTAADQRAFVASAHNVNAGYLFSAMESGGTVAWLVDARGQMRAQAPTAFGGGQLTSGVPLSAAPGASDATAADLYAAASGKTALRVFRALGDSAAIASFGQDNITLGRSTSWSSGSVNVLGPRLNVAGALDVGGALDVDGTATLGGLNVDGTVTFDALNVGGAFDVNGATTLAGLTAGTSGLGATTVSSLTVSSGTSSLRATTATSLTVSGASNLGSTTVSSLTATSSVQGASVTASGTVQGASLTATGGLSLHGGLVTSATSSPGAELRTRPPSQQGGGTFQQSVRQPMVYTMTYTSNLRIETTSSGTGAATSIRTVTMPEDGWMRLDADLLFTGDIGAVGAEAEIFKVFITVELVSSSGTLLDTSQQYVSAFTSDAPERQKQGMGMTHITEVWPQRLSAGSYQVRLRMFKQGALSGEFTRATYTVQPVVLHAAST